METKGAYLSPGKIHGIDFIFHGEIRFGPDYFRIKLNGKIIKNRIFGYEFKWHSDAHYLALQEWLTTDYQKGPITALALIKPYDKKIAQVARTDGGFIKPLSFEENVILYQKQFYSTGINKSCEINLEDINNWQDLIQ